tara:strand:+ start:533 stop:1303 length:771 start_codon:yes stop_codon:yes gene_type:complete
MADETVKLIKEFLTNQDANNTIDRSFSELISKRNRISIPEFFDYYNNLFYDIPQLGTLSHKELVDRSIEYLGNYTDPRDIEIQNLNQQLEELSKKVNELEFNELQDEIADMTTKVVVTLQLNKGDHPGNYSRVKHKEIDTHRLIFQDGINDKYLHGSYKKFKNETFEFTTTAPIFTLFYNGRNKVRRATGGNHPNGVAWRTEYGGGYGKVTYEIPEGDNVFPVLLSLDGREAHNMSYTNWQQEAVDLAASEGFSED